MLIEVIVIATAIYLEFEVYFSSILVIYYSNISYSMISYFSKPI